MKTAVQWLDEQIKEKMGLDEHDTNQLKWFIDKALEKEKEQIQNVFEHCWNHPNWKGEYDIKDMQEYLKTNNQNK